MSDSPKLTPRQQEILELIQNTIATTGAPPTRAEISNTLGFKSASPTAHREAETAKAHRG